jgi:hypothetical protein
MQSPADDQRPTRSSMDDVIDVYKKSVDRTLLREMLALTPEQRLERLLAFLRAARELRRAVSERS